MQIQLQRVCHFWPSVLSGVALLGLPAGVSAAPPTTTQTVGGPEGTPFRFQCAPKEFLVGLRAKAGQAIVRVGPVCAAWIPERRVTGPIHELRTEFGGTGGEWTRFGCPPNSALSGWLIEDSRGTDPLAVGNIAQQECRELFPPYNQLVNENRFIGHTQFPPSGIAGIGAHFKSAPIWVRCPAGQFANGIYGAAGTLVNRIGLFCASPEIAVTAPVHRGPLLPNATYATAIDDVDVYDRPNGDTGKVIGMMRKGESHIVIERSEGWSELANEPAAAQQGWVADDHLSFHAR